MPIATVAAKEIFDNFGKCSIAEIARFCEARKIAKPTDPIQCEDGSQFSLIHSAAFHGNFLVLNSLVQRYGEDISRSTSAGDSVLHCALRGSHVAGPEREESFARFFSALFEEYEKEMGEIINQKNSAGESSLDMVKGGRDGYIAYELRRLSKISEPERPSLERPSLAVSGVGRSGAGAKTTKPLISSPLMRH